MRTSCRLILINHSVNKSNDKFIITSGEQLRLISKPNRTPPGHSQKLRTELRTAQRRLHHSLFDEVWAAKQRQMLIFLRPSQICSLWPNLESELRIERLIAAAFLCLVPDLDSGAIRWTKFSPWSTDRSQVKITRCRYEIQRLCPRFAAARRQQVTSQVAVGIA